MKRKSSVMVAMVLSASMLLAGCGGAETVQETESAVLVDVQAAGRDTLVLSNQFVGNVSPEESVYIIPMAQGKVTETFFEVGDEVQAGDVLFKIDDSGAQLQLQQAQLSYSTAKQKADSALTTQEDASTNLKLDASVSQAETAYMQAQVAWKNAKDAEEDAEDAVEAQEELLNSLRANGADAATIAGAEATLSTLKSRESQADMAANVAEAAYATATTSFEAAKAARDLARGDALEDTKEQLDTSLQLAQVAVDSAELALSYYTVTTPISGKVIAKNVEVNGMATATTAAYTIAGENTMVVTFQVSESIMNTLAKDQKVVVERNGVTYDGVVTEVGNAVNPQTGLFQIKAAVYANGEELPSGVSVKVSSDTYTAENEIIIPYDAVYFENEGAYVYTVKDGHAVKTYVTTGIFDDTRIQIIDGIAEGDIVITSWSPRLLDGVEVDAKVAEKSAETEGIAQ